MGDILSAVEIAVAAILGQAGRAEDRVFILRPDGELEQSFVNEEGAELNICFEYRGFLDTLCARMPVPTWAVRVDGARSSTPPQRPPDSAAACACLCCRRARGRARSRVSTAGSAPASVSTTPCARIRRSAMRTSTRACRDENETKISMEKGNR